MERRFVKAAGKILVPEHLDALLAEGAIATHIADMLALENGSYVYVEYSGIYNLNGTDFYEFRCYR
ncbi:MAG: hypothetical protein J6K43_05305 [Lachnospiraceae bacterium]|nr:hypothetical protein [Lachnospiraceae bacterium]